MIYPVTLYNFGKVCRDSATAGNVLRALCKQTVELTEAERIVVDMIQNDSEWMNERIEDQRERWKDRQRKSRLSRNVTDVTVTSVTPECHRDKRDTPNVTIPPSLPPSLPPSKKNKNNTNRSVTVPLQPPQTERNGNGTEDDVLLKGGIDNARKLAREFAEAVKQDQGAFFSGEWDATTICLALTGDYRSAKRWRQLSRQKGDAAIVEECFAFWREISAGEDVDNRGRALNARLAKLPDQPKQGKEG